MERKYVRLKTSLKQEHIEERLQYEPTLMEIHINDTDLEKPVALIEAIRFIKKHDVKVYLHHPPKYKGEFVDILSKQAEIRAFYDWSTKLLIEICQQEEIAMVIHAHYTESESSQLENVSIAELKQRISSFEKLAQGVLRWENTIEGAFSQRNPSFIKDIVKPLNLPLCFDMSHAFIALHGDNEALLSSLKEVSPFIQYFHVVDSLGDYHDGLPIGAGNINWESIIPFIVGKDYIFEIDLSESDHTNCEPMLASGKYFQSIVNRLSHES